MISIRRPRFPTLPSADRPQVSRTAAALGGVVAAAVALGVGELVAGLVAPLRSPIEAVAASVIDLTPGPIERFAIETLGSADKPALVIGTLVLSAAFGAVLGLLSRSRVWLGALGLALFGALGVAATLRQADGVLASVPSVVAAAAGVIALVVLFTGRGREGSSADATDEDRSRSDGGRRAFLLQAGVLAAGAALTGGGGRWLATRFSAAASREEVALPRPQQTLPAVPDAVSVQVDGMTPFVTPKEQFYRVDTALTVPQVQVADWRLRIVGMVDRPLELTYDDLLDMDLVERDITLACVSNTVGGDLVGHARWSGVPLADLLERAGVQRGATQVVGRSVDDYTCGFPVAEVAPRGSLVAVGMNGEPLPIERGFPARLVTPGLYGYVSATKWLTEIELTTFDAFDQYWVPRGWDERAPIKTMARIDVPASLGRVAPGSVDVAGVAWAQTRGISRVELRIDDGPWQETELAEQLNEDSWRQWRYRWDVREEGQHRLTVRATDGDGNVQTQERTEPFPNGASGWMTLAVVVSSEA